MYDQAYVDELKATLSAVDAHYRKKIVELQLVEPELYQAEVDKLVGLSDGRWTRTDPLGEMVDELIAERDELDAKLATAELEATVLSGRMDKLRDLRPVLERWGGYAVDEGWCDEETMRGVLAQFDAMTKGS